MDLAATLSGLFTGLSLIVAIGAQNAFVLRQGLTGRYVFPVAAVSAVLDAVLIIVGVAGLGALLQSSPIALEIVRWCGAAYLTWFGIGSVRRAIRGEAMEIAQSGPTSLIAAIVTTITFSLLNPHVYLDTVVFLGSIAAQFGESKWWFALGAATASLLWFFGLAYGAKQLSRFVTTVKFWRILDSIIALIMFTLALSLVLKG